MLSVVHPSPPVVALDCNVFQDDAVESLPTINTTRTLAAKLCGRLDDAAFNAKVIELTRRSEVWAHVAAAVASAAGFTLYLVSNLPTRAVMTSVNVVSGAFFAVHTCASLSWDMLQLVLTTFAFWFLFAMNATNTTLWCLLFHDSRVAAFVMIGVLFAMTLTIDANIYSRHLAARFFVLAAPSLFLVLTLTAAHIPPDLHYQHYRVLGVQIDAIDLLVNSNLVLVYFTSILVVRSRGLLFNIAPVRAIKCEFYIPLCHLVPQSNAELFAREASLHAMSKRNLNEPRPLRQIKLLRDRDVHAIDVRRVLMPSVSRYLNSTRARSALNRAGFIGLLLTISAFFWGLLLDRASKDTHVFPLAAVGLVMSAALVLSHVADLQRNLFRRVFAEVDAWFVSFHVSAVSLGSCDLVCWNRTDATLLLTAWMWCHWAVFLDALPPATRKRVGFSRPLLLFVSTLLAVYPLLVAISLHILRPSLFNRVIIHVGYGSVNVHSDMLGFVASKLFMLWVWMLRGLWRELKRPAESFKLLERKAFYHVDS